MSVNHVNFYENIKEAHIRLLHTVVMYDGIPYLIRAITADRADGVFRVYLAPVDNEGKERAFPEIHSLSPEGAGIGKAIDTWMEANPKSGWLRKKMNSPLFNKFRPFPLGMCNYGTNTFYLQRQPQRNREQGLTQAMVSQSLISLDKKAKARAEAGMGGIVPLDNIAFRGCVLSQHPSPQECVANLNDPDIANEAVAFHRDFAFVRGPIDMMFLAYKDDIIGALPNRDFSQLRLGRHYNHTREVVSELNLFGNIVSG